MTMIFSQIDKGQYEVTIDLNGLMDKCQMCCFKKKLEELYKYENEYAFVSSINNRGILRYKSETLIPEEKSDKRQKLLFVFGNPANHSIIQGMFFFSNKDGTKHRIWSKLDDASVIKQISSHKDIPIDARKEEAEDRKTIILNGNQSQYYLVGMTTFYSFPTSADGGVKKVEDLFDRILQKMQKNETDRIEGYSFTNDSKLIFVQQSSYDAFKNCCHTINIENILFWPIRGKGSSGEDLKALLRDHCN